MKGHGCLWLKHRELNCFPQHTSQKGKTQKSSHLVYSTKHVKGHGCLWLKHREINCFFIKNLKGNGYIFV